MCFAVCPAQAHHWSLLQSGQWPGGDERVWAGTGPD